MPRAGYVSISITEEAKKRLEELKNSLGARSLSEVILVMYEIKKELDILWEKTNNRHRKFHKNRRL